MRVASVLIAAIILIFSFTAAYFLIEGVIFKKSFNELAKNKETEIKLRIEEIKKQMLKDFDAKYKVDFISFEKLAKNIESERKRIRDLEGEILKMKK